MNEIERDQMIERMLAAFNSGLVDLPDPENPRGFITVYQPKAAMDAAIAAMRGEPVSLMDQIKRDAALVAALPEHERRNYQREFEAVLCNPGITFPTPPDSGKD